jgi:hypothetical protein
MIYDECGAVCGMKIGKGNRMFVENLPQGYFVHHKYNMT